jgi:two-component system sensor histidine kinase BaeS
VEHTPSETAHVEEAFASAMVFSLVVALAVALAIAFAVTWFFTHRVKRSIDAVADSATRIADGDYRVRILPPGLGAEFDLLGTTINQLADRLEKVEQTRRRMLSDLAHEMRTPVATIDAHLEAIEDGVRTADADTLAVLRSSTERLARLGQDISAVSKAEEGQLPIDPRPVRVTELVRTAISAAAHDAANKGIHLLPQIESESIEVQADPERMGQVLGNLLDNAIRHSPSGSTVVVSSRRVDRHWVELSVADTGEGIAAEHLGHVFDRFYRADTARNRGQGGSGIGLTITRALVEAHGGQISVTSPGPGAGATFTIRLRAPR